MSEEGWKLSTFAGRLRGSDLGYRHERDFFFVDLTLFSGVVESEGSMITIRLGFISPTYYQ